MSQEYNNMSDAEKKKEDWMNSKWRPMMGWLYMAVCAFDFVIFPILWSLLHAIMHSTTLTQWQPLTLQGAGLFHIAMGAVLGIAALGRTQEKMAGANNGGAAATPVPFTPPAPVAAPVAAPAAFVPPAVVAPKPFVPAAPTASPVVASNGKLGPAPADEPEL